MAGKADLEFFLGVTKSYDDDTGVIGKIEKELKLKKTWF